ncbi:recombination protein NinB [Pontibacterium sp.]|uniref:recombination protein NinB n=1 Tax=Pontibacterium sp. TaxID=2036026 RepID=UPI0035695FF3
MATESIEIIIQNPLVKRERMSHAWELVSKALQAGPVVVTLGREKRTLDQNAKLWAMLTDVSRQVEWYGRKLTNEDWKHVMTAGLKQQEAVPGINGGFVVLGQSTSKMRKREFAELIELIYAFGCEHGVKWSEKSEGICAEYKQWLEEARAKERGQAA